MKLKDARENYYFFSGKVSDIVRQLGLAGIAVVWVFKVDIDGNPTVPPLLMSAARFIIIGLGLDLLHYVVGTLVWGVFSRCKERAGTADDADFDAPPQINWLTIFFFWAKVILMMVAYCYILRFLAERIMR